MYCKHTAMVRVEWSVLYIFWTLQIGSVIYCQTHSNEATNSTKYLTPPLPKGSPYPLLLQERDVIHYLNSKKEFVKVGDGVYADVYLGELRKTGVHVVVKSFRDSSFGEIMREVRMHRYAQQFVRTPRLIGLLPTGPLASNISLVYEYIHHAKSISAWMDDDDKGGFTTTQWLLVCRQLAVAMQHIHEADIYFNDLHRGNVLVQKLFDQVRVFLIDFGMATYSRGKSYKKTNDTLENYNFLAPELLEITTTKVSDIFSVGHTIYRIAEVVNMTGLFHLSAWSKAFDPRDRPTLSQIILKLDSFLFEQSLRDLKQSFILPYYSLYTDMGSSSQTDLIVKSNTETSVEWEWLTTVGQVLSSYCMHPIFVISDEDYYGDVDDKHEYITKATYDSIRLANLKIGNQTVIVKDFYKVEFDEVVKEICVTSYLAHKGVAPRVLGILIEYKHMYDTAFVQERYGHGVTLKEFVSHTAGFEWDRKRLKKIAKGDFDIDDSLRAAHFPPTTTPFSFTNAFLALFTSPQQHWCGFKSPRQVLLEKVSALTIGLVKATHQAGMLINNLIGDNVLVKWKGKAKKEPDISVKLIDLKRSTSINEGFHFSRSARSLSQYTYLAPEVIQGQKASRSSDVYSLCVLLQWIMADYFTANNVFVGLYNNAGKHNARSQQKNCTSCCVHDSCNTFTVHQKYGKPDVPLFKFDYYYNQYQHLLLKCLNASPHERPDIEDLSNILSLIRKTSDWKNTLIYEKETWQ